MSDLISRKWLMECVDEGWIKFDTEKDKNIYVHLVRDIAPSAQPERKTGRWIFEERKRLVDETDDGAVYRTEKWWSCSECGYTKGYHISKPSSNYCENCGAEMLKEGKE